MVGDSLSDFGRCSLRNSVQNYMNSIRKICSLVVNSKNARALTDILKSFLHDIDIFSCRIIRTKDDSDALHETVQAAGGQAADALKVFCHDNIDAEALAAQISYNAKVATLLEPDTPASIKAEINEEGLRASKLELETLRMRGLSEEDKKRLEERMEQRHREEERQQSL
jgi:hypothetical protein